MKRLLNSTLFRWAVIIIIIVGNISFYTWGGYEHSGAKYAMDIHFLFWLMLQLMFLYAIIGLIIMWWKKW